MAGVSVGSVAVTGAAVFVATAATVHNVVMCKRLVDAIVDAVEDEQNEGTGKEKCSKQERKKKKVNEPKNVKRQAKKLSPEAKKGYQKAINGLADGDTRGLNDHPLGGNRSGQRAADIKGTGSGRGAGRVVYEYGENGEINIIEIIINHNY